MTSFSPRGAGCIFRLARVLLGCGEFPFGLGDIESIVSRFIDTERMIWVLKVLLFLFLCFFGILRMCPHEAFRSVVKFKEALSMRRNIPEIGQGP